ncbi:MAG: hypothetical protein WC071_04575 [Victivallaceae bacterium]
MVKRLQIIFLIFFSINTFAGIKIEKLFDGKNQVTGYVIVNKFFKAVLVDPGQVEAENYGEDVCRGGWFRDIILKNTKKNLLGECRIPGGEFRFGLAQIFEPTITIPADDKVQPADMVTGGGKIKQSKDGRINISEVFPWKTSVEEETGKIVVSFSQDATLSNDFAYKMRIDLTFTDSASVTVKGIFFNTGQKEFTANICLAPVFENPYEDTAWITVPHLDARKQEDKRINIISKNPILVKELGKEYLFNESRLSKANRWVAAGGLTGNAVFAFLGELPIDKVAFWKNAQCFSLKPYINITAAPGVRTEWKWNVIFGRGLNRVSKVTDKGIFAFYAEQGSNVSERLLKMDFMPLSELNGLFLDSTVKTMTGRMIMTKSSEMIKISPLQPGVITLKLPDHIKKDNNYLLKLELFSGDNLFYEMTEAFSPEL